MKTIVLIIDYFSDDVCYFIKINITNYSRITFLGIMSKGLLHTVTSPLNDTSHVVSYPLPSSLDESYSPINKVLFSKSI